MIEIGGSNDIPRVENTANFPIRFKVSINFLTFGTHFDTWYNYFNI